ncbi:SOS response-associated peptidase [Cohaesibacter celericrescens]|uniref:Abasic site processing protein n=1 Tax=Cohaesibacter celericrescens TaxID=2067669 RepID=A0A2N5XKU9_9HYPH|nr:SOS response-associated peptidase [Cohaesibacter celericrescens]PLW75068.1 DUF159 family protein [Cohaesibacter celericrescens]
MSGRIVLAAENDDLLRAFGSDGQLSSLHPMPPRYNIAPTQPVLTIVKERGVNLVRLMRWGFLPEWVKDPKDYALVNSARSETVEEKPSFRNAIRRRRCVIPVSGFYEWSGSCPNGGSNRAYKQPYYIASAEGKIMALAGIWETWMGPYGEEVDTTAILTNKAQGAMADISGRMPVLIEPQDLDLWLDTSSDLMKDARPLLRRPYLRPLKIHPVSSKVNSVGNDDASLIEPLAAGRSEQDARATENDLVETRVDQVRPSTQDLDLNADQNADISETSTQLTLL